MDPNATSLYAFALGLEGNGEGDAWRLIAINFGSVLTAPCKFQVIPAYLLVYF